jgi:hypothetical protein
MIYMKISIISLIVAVLFCGLTPASFAQEPLQRGACKADVAKFCKDVQQGQGRIVRCMKAHENELSPACKNLIAAQKEKSREFMQSCKADEAKFCNGIKPGGGRIINCLKQHEAELSADCKTHIPKR